MKSLAGKFFFVTVAHALLQGNAQRAAGAGPEVDPVALVRALEGEDESVRRQAARALVKLSAKAVPDLLEALGHKKQDVRLRVMEVLGTIGPPAEAAVPLLGRLLYDGEVHDAAAAASALAKIGPAAVPEIVKSAGHKVERTRDAALAALAAVEGPPRKVVPALASPLASDDVAVRRHATMALFRSTTEPVDAVLRAFRDEDAEVRAVACNALSRSKYRATAEWTKALEALLQHPTAGVRGDALQVLAHDPATRMKYGLQGMKDADAGVRVLALHALDRATSPVERNPYTVGKIVAQIAPALTDPSKDVRKVAFTMMQRSWAEGVPYLAALLDAKDSDIRRQAAEALLYVGSRKADLVEAKLLELAERDPDTAVRAAAVQAYCMLGTKSVPAVARLFRREREDDVRIAVMRTLCQHREEAASLAPDFLAALQDANPQVRRAAAYTFYWMTKSGKQAIPALTAALHDRDARVREQAIYSLSMLTPESEPGILEGIKSEDAAVQETALHTFWQRGLKAKAALPWLIKALKREGYRNVRTHAIYCLGNLGADAAEAIPALEAITDSDMQVHIRFGMQRIRGTERN